MERKAIWVAYEEAENSPNCGDQEAFEEWVLGEYIENETIKQLIEDFKANTDWMNEAIEEIDEPDFFYSLDDPICPELFDYNYFPFNEDRLSAGISDLNMRVTINGQDRYFSFKHIYFEADQIAFDCGIGLSQMTANAFNIGLAAGAQRVNSGDLVLASDQTTDPPIPSLPTEIRERYTIWVEIQKEFRKQILNCAGDYSTHYSKSFFPTYFDVVGFTQNQNTVFTRFEDEFDSTCH